MRQLTQQDLNDIRAHFPIEACLPYPGPQISAQAAAEFDVLFDQARQQGPAAQIQYHLPYPKYQFLEHLAETRGVLLHGSTLRGLEVLNPVRQSSDSTEFGNQAAIYATQDPIWALFFAVLDKNKLHGVVSNGAIHLKGDDGSFLRRYYFCIDVPSLRSGPWSPGAIYILPPEQFEPDPNQLNYRIGPYALQVTHWIYRGTLTPLAWVPVEAEDFPYLHKVWGYDPQEFDKRMSGPSLAGWPFLADRTLYPINPLEA